MPRIRSKINIRAQKGSRDVDGHGGGGDQETWREEHMRNEKCSKLGNYIDLVRRDESQVSVWKGEK